MMAASVRERRQLPRLSKIPRPRQIANLVLKWSDLASVHVPAGALSFEVR
jgi:hypothetical protein